MNDGERRAPAGDVVGVVAVWAVLAVLGGAAAETAAPHLGGGSGLWLVNGAAIAAVSAALVASRRRAAPRLGAGVGVLVSLVVIAAIAGGVMLRMDASDRGLLVALADAGGSAPLSGEVVAEPRPTAAGWHVIVEVDDVDGVPTRERAMATRPVPPRLGQRVRLVATARPLPESGYGRWVARQHATVLLDTLEWEEVGHPAGLAAASEALRSRVRSAATRHLDQRVGGLLVGFVTGDTRLLPEADRQAMQRTGLTHLTAVSGSNVALVAAGVLTVCRSLRLGVRVRRTALAVTLPWFAFVTRFEPSVLRAGVMAAVLLLATATGRTRDARHALAIGVILLVAVDPRLTASLGLVLSAAATAGVLAIAPVVRRRLTPRVPSRIAEVLSITVGAQIAVLPVLLASFGEVALSSVPANLVAVPAAAFAATLAFVGTAVSVVHVDLAAPLFAIAAPGALAVLHIAHAFADVGGVVSVARLLDVAAVVAAIAWLLIEARQVRVMAAAITVTAVIATSMPFMAGVMLPRDFTVTAIDVGQGDAFLVETPRTRILVDAGSDVTAARWLRRNGVRRLDLLVVTHPHLDHVGGVAEVMRRVDVDVVWAAPMPTRLPEAAEMHRVAASRGTPVSAPIAGMMSTFGDVAVEVLNPPPGRPYRHASSELNESSYVLRIHHDGRRALLTGDVEATAQQRLLSGDADRLAAELLTVPHHGSATSEPAFIEAVGAEVALIGVGAANEHGHPHPRILSVLAELGVEVRRTDVDGTVRVLVPDVWGPRALGPVAIASPVVGKTFRTSRPWPARGRSGDVGVIGERRRRFAGDARDRPSCRSAGSGGCRPRRAALRRL